MAYILKDAQGNLTAALPPIGNYVEVADTDPTVVEFVSISSPPFAAQVSYRGALAAGLTISWQTSQALNGTYVLDQQAQFNITAETVSILTNGTFTNGKSARNWPLINGIFVSLSIAQFKTFATAVAQYVDDLQTALSVMTVGQSATWPESSIILNA